MFKIMQNIARLFTRENVHAETFSIEQFVKRIRIVRFTGCRGSGDSGTTVDDNAEEEGDERRRKNLTTQRRVDSFHHGVA